MCIVRTNEANGQTIKGDISVSNNIEKINFRHFILDREQGIELDENDVKIYMCRFFNLFSVLRAQ